MRTPSDTLTRSCARSAPLPDLLYSAHSVLTSSGHAWCLLQVRFAASLTQLDISDNPIDDEGYRVIGGLLLLDDSPCRLAYLRCDAFELLPATTEFASEDARADPQAAVAVTSLPIRAAVPSISSCGVEVPSINIGGIGSSSAATVPSLAPATLAAGKCGRASGGGAGGATSSAMSSGGGAGSCDATGSASCGASNGSAGSRAEPTPSRQRRLLPGALALLAGVVRHNMTLTRLSLVDAALDAEAATALATAVHSNAALTELDLTGNCLLRGARDSLLRETEDCSGVDALTRAIAAAASRRLASVTLDSIALPVRSVNGTERMPCVQRSSDSSALPRQAPHCGSVLLMKPAFAFCGAERLARIRLLIVSCYLPPSLCTPLRTLDLSNLQLGTVSSMVLGGLIGANTALTELNLQGNERMSALGCGMIVSNVCAPLKALNLALNSLGGEEHESGGGERGGDVSGGGSSGGVEHGGSGGSSGRLAGLLEAVARLGSLERLALNHNGLYGGERLAPLCRMSTLQKLALNNNRLGSLPAAIGQLRSLIELCVFNNSLTALPESVGELHALVKLQAQSNQLAALPESFGLLGELRVAALSHNRLSCLPPSIADLPKLEKLEVARNPLEKPPIMVVRQGLEAMRKFFAEERGASAGSPERSLSDRSFAADPPDEQMPHSVDRGLSSEQPNVNL